MRLNLEINRLAKCPIKDEFFQAVGRATFRAIKKKILSDKKIDLSLALVSSAEIRKVNKKYRKKDSPTDVLSFAEYKNWEAVRKVKGKEIFLGELLVCYDDIVKYARSGKKDISEETAQVFSHGILHLLGYSHGWEMFSIQEKIKKLFSKKQI